MKNTKVWNNSGHLADPFLMFFNHVTDIRDIERFFSKFRFSQTSYYIHIVHRIVKDFYVVKTELRHRFKAPRIQSNGFLQQLTNSEKTKYLLYLCIMSYILDNILSQYFENIGKTVHCRTACSHMRYLNLSNFKIYTNHDFKNKRTDNYFIVHQRYFTDIFCHLIFAWLYHCYFTLQWLCFYLPAELFAIMMTFTNELI